MAPKLSARLEAILAWVPPGSVLVDVGTDHGYLPIAAVARGQAARAIGIDRSPLPLALAERHRAAAGVGERVELRLGTGLAPLGLERADVLTVAGMGGHLAARILAEAADRLPGFRRLVIQPNRDAEAVRAWAWAAGWHLVAETMVEEEGRVFVILAFEPGNGADPAYARADFTRDELFVLGPRLLAERDALAARCYERQRARLERLPAGRGAREAALFARALAALT